MIRVRTTKNCPNTPRILLALEEMGLSYETELVADGVFTAGWGSPGPSLHDGDVETIEPGAILRHLVRREHGALWPTTLAAQATADRWIEFQSRRLSRAIEARDPAEIARLLAFIDKQLTPGPWLLGDTFTMVDVAYAVLASPQARAMLPLAQFPAISAFGERLLARPAMRRAMQRYAAAQPT